MLPVKKDSKNVKNPGFKKVETIVIDEIEPKEEIKDVKETVTEAKATQNSPINVHVPVTESFLSNLGSLQGLVNIHFHIHTK